MGLRRAAFFIFLFSQVGFAQEVVTTPVYGAHHGYVADVVEEKSKKDIELVLLEQPKDPPQKSKTALVSDKLSREFKIQYEYRFGQTQAEQVINSPGQFDEYSYYTGNNITLKQYRKYQQNFAEYMVRRLTEYHVDNWAKNDPSIRPMYEFKDKISNINMQVRKGYKFKWKYNFSGPSMDFALENPYDIDSKVRVDMSGIISAPREVIYSFGYQVNPRVHTAFLHKSDDGIYQVVASRRLNRSVTASITASKDTRKEGPNYQQDLFLLGFSWAN